MSQPILLAQVTDSHLLAKTTDLLRGCNTWQTFNMVLQEVAHCEPDGLLLTGDLAEQGEAEAYGNLVDAIVSVPTCQFAPLPMPIYWLPGNHDRVDILQQAFQVLPASQGLRSIDLGQWQLILLDSVFLDATFGEGHLSEQQLQKLRFYLTNHPPKPTLIALHHHPVPVGIDWVDQIGVKNADEFFTLIEEFSQVKLVVFGHIHHEFQYRTARGIGVYGCPSTCLQVTPAIAAMDDQRPGFRLIWLYGDGRYETEVRRVNVVKDKPHDWDPKPPVHTSTSHLTGLIILTLALLVTFLASLILGSVAIPPNDVLTVLFGGVATKPAWQEIILNFRLPRSLTAMTAGAALAISGLQLQALFRNPLAGPSVLGINAGASLGVALIVLTGGSVGWWGQLSVVAAASGGAAIAMLLILLMARQIRSSLALLIFGLMLGYITTALVTILLHFSQLEQTLAYLNWTFGSFSGVTWQQLPILLSVVIFGLTLAQLTCKPLNLLLLGEEQAISLGLSITMVRCYLIFSASLLAGSITAFCGPIAFLGVAVPHLGRSLCRTQDHRVLVPVVALLGALLALVANSIAQVPGSQTVLPLNAVTALLGAPVLIWLMLKYGKQQF